MKPTRTSQFHSSLRVLPGSIWEGPSGTAYVGVVADKAVVAVLIGRVDAGASELLYQAIHGALVGGGAALFYEIWGMEWYHSAVRVRCTAVALAHIDRVPVHTLANSKLVRMGVAVANLALGGRLITHDEPDTFSKEIQRVASGQAAGVKNAG
jgi:hypothetical protein